MKEYNSYVDGSKVTLVPLDG